MLKLHALQKNPYPNKFVVFEGIDGSGKTTQVKLLGEALARHKIPVLLTKEPTEEGMFGDLVRFIYSSEGRNTDKLEKKIIQLLRKKEYWTTKIVAESTQKPYFHRFEEIADEILAGRHGNIDFFIQLCMIFDRYDHRTRVEIPTLERGIHVISDRDFLSTLAYGRASGLDWKMLLTMHMEILETDFIVPDLVIFCEVPVRVGVRRTLEKQRGSVEHFDGIEKARTIRRTYHDVLAYFSAQKTFRVETIRGIDSVEKIHEKIFSVVAPFLMSPK